MTMPVFFGERAGVHCHLVKISEIIFTVGCRADA
jgi:hypothetical protein